MIFRELKVEDVDRVRNLHAIQHAQSFSLHSRKNLVGEQIAEFDGRIVAYGALRKTVEPILIMDLDASLRARMTAMDGLIQSAVLRAGKFGYEELRAQTSDPNFARILEKRYLFEQLEGVALILEV